MCLPGRQLAPIDRQATPYRRQSILDSLEELRYGGGLDRVDDEIAALVDHVQTLLTDMGLDKSDRQFGKVSDGKFMEELRLTLEAVVNAKAKRQKMIADSRLTLTVDGFRLLVGELKMILRRHIKDPDTLEAIGLDISRLDMRVLRGGSG